MSFVFGNHLSSTALPSSTYSYIYEQEMLSWLTIVLILSLAANHTSTEESSALASLTETADEYEEYTEEIEEIYQESDDNGKTWKTVKKITTITPSGTTERTVVMEGTKTRTALCTRGLNSKRCCSAHVTLSLARPDDKS